MDDSPRQRARYGGLGLWKSIVTLSILAGVFCVWCSCTVTKSNYATLSYFFDGVPNPNAPSGRPAEPGDSTISLSVVEHAPFKQEKCEACHKTQYRPSRNDATPCLECHKGIADKHTWTHGAVAGGACLWCHSPHESQRKWLLRKPDRELCMQCHSPALMNTKAVPAHGDAKMGCLECHFGHGGDTPTMLKPGSTAQAPPPVVDAPAKEATPAEKAKEPSKAEPASTPPPPAPAQETPK